MSASPSTGIYAPDSPFGAVAGESVKYLIAVTNHGPSDTSDVAVKDTLGSFIDPSSVQVCDGNGSNCQSVTVANDGSVSVASNVALTASGTGSTKSFVVTALVGHNTPHGSTLTNNGSASSNGDSTDPGHRTATKRTSRSRPGRTWRSLT